MYSMLFLAAAFPQQAPESTSHWIPHNLRMFVCLYVFIYVFEKCVQGRGGCCVEITVLGGLPTICKRFGTNLMLFFSAWLRSLVPCDIVFCLCPPCWAAFASSRSWYCDRVLVEYRIQVVARLDTNLCSHATRVRFRIEQNFLRVWWPPFLQSKFLSCF